MKILSVGLMALMASTSAWAEAANAAQVTSPSPSDSSPIPEPLLKLEFQRCLKGCVPDFNEAACVALCDCSVQQFKKRLNYGEYVDMLRQLASGNVTPKNSKMLDSVAHYCSAAVDKAGIAVGPAEAKDAAKDAAKPDVKPDTPKSPK
ncbi:hypothetical protein [Kordiimonas marina]|uniref:hypothetical protein n=1 Tax=Kordiimonas marina TaxID=2872312 RepID=UPI001FF691AA|nr:hypothetical protein [Kordiimonas marina]MCJ9427455.1 hypothetical protein [Kordiimonas marina]